jgi:hypothetical protein
MEQRKMFYIKQKDKELFNWFDTQAKQLDISKSELLARIIREYKKNMKE